MNKYKTMNILGDSITWGYNPSNGEQMKKNYSNLLKERLNLKEVRNYGINSSTLADNKISYEPMCNRYKYMDNNADIVVIFGGTNDYGREDFEVKLGKKNDLDTSTIYGALNNMCIGLKQKYPNSVIFFITPIQRAYIDKGCNFKYSTNTKNSLDYSLQDVANAIKEVCKKNNILVFDLYNDCNINTIEDCKKYIPDGLHPTEEYHKILADKIYDYIIKL